MRSNIARTCGSSRVPGARSPRLVMPATLLRSLAAAQLPEELDEGVEFVRRALLQPGERRHRRGRVDERPRDRLLWQARRDVGQVRARPVVAVLADLVARQTARLADDELALLVVGERLPALRGDPRGRWHVDLGRRAGGRA